MRQFLLARVVPDGADWQRARPVDTVKLTAVQQRIYDFVRERQLVWGETPTYREIAEAEGVALRSISAVHRQIGLMRDKGVLIRPPGRHRALWLTALLQRPSDDTG